MAGRSRKKNRLPRSTQPGRSAAPRPLVRVSARAAAALFVVAAVVGSVYGLGRTFRRILLTGNPHFTCRQIRVTTDGRLRPAEIRQLVRESGVHEGETNLFAIDLRRLRERIRRTSPLVREVQLIRRLPDTLEVRVAEREPVAQLLRTGGRLLDEKGVILPPRPDEDVALLPILVGVRNAHRLPTGATMRDELVQGALRLVTLIRTEGFDREIDPILIQLDYARKRLVCYVHPKSCFRKNAMVILPIKDIRTALWRVQQIARERARAHQTIGYIDATYEINVPIRP